MFLAESFDLISWSNIELASLSLTKLMINPSWVDFSFWIGGLLGNKSLRISLNSFEDLLVPVPFLLIFLSLKYTPTIVEVFEDTRHEA